MRLSSFVTENGYPSGASVETFSVSGHPDRSPVRTSPFGSMLRSPPSSTLSAVMLFAPRRATSRVPTVIFPASRDATTPLSAVMAPTAIFSVVIAPFSMRVAPATGCRRRFRNQMVAVESPSYAGRYLRTCGWACLSSVTVMVPV